MVLALIVALALPVALAAQALIVHSAGIADAMHSFLDRPDILTLPAYIRDLPLVGPSIDRYWQTLMQSQGEAMDLARKLADPARRLLVVMGAAVAHGLIQVLIAIFVAFFFYRDGERLRGLLHEGLARLAGRENAAAISLTTQNAVRGVVYGLLGTALAQAAVSVVGFLIVGLNGAFVLGALTFILSLVPMGPVVIWGGAAIWLYAHDLPGRAIFMVIYGLAVISSVDNFVKPILMSRAGGLSLPLAVLGVFGGAIAFGFIGLFVGPALLAVGWSLAKAWLEVPPAAPSQPEATK